MNKFTSGPWRWMTGYEGEREFCDIDKFKAIGYGGNPELIGPDDQPIISAGSGEYTPYRGENGPANARLIAVAPRMITALQRAAYLLAEVAPREHRLIALRSEIIEIIKQATPEHYGLDAHDK